VQVNPATASTTNVSGTASLAGTVAAVFAPGSYVSRSYTILTATGGVTGTFDTLETRGLLGRVRHESELYEHYRNARPQGPARSRTYAAYAYAADVAGGPAEADSAYTGAAAHIWAAVGAAAPAALHRQPDQPGPCD
jgi:hypothetical protein